MHGNIYPNLTMSLGMQIFDNVETINEMTQGNKYKQNVPPFSVWLAVEDIK